MGLETGTWVNDLVTTNPPGTDKKNQGDDHLRLLKSVLKSTFPNASKAFYFPTSAPRIGDYSIVAADLNKVLVVDTTLGAINLTLPTLGAGDYGWEITVVKKSLDRNPVFILPASGALCSGEFTTLTKTRRGIPNRPFKCRWVEGIWIVDRCVNMPLGTVFPHYQTSGTVPVGYEQAGGQNVSSAANYPDYFALSSSTLLPDLRGRAAFGLDTMGGFAAGRLGSVIGSPNTVGGTGGVEFQQLVQANLPNSVIDISGLSVSGVSGSVSGIGATVNITDTRSILVPDLNTIGNVALGGVTSLASSYHDGTFSSHAAAFSGGSISGSFSGATGSLSGGTGSVSGTLRTGGSTQAFGIMPPTYMVNYLVVVE